MSRYPIRTPAESSSDKGGVAAVDRALMLLTAFQDGDRVLSLAELAERTQLVKSTILRLLVSLLHFELVQKTEDGRYALGPEVARLQRIYTASFSLDSLVLPCLRELVDTTRESVSFHIRQGNHRLILHRISSPQPISDQGRQGELLPLDRGSGGRVLLAFSGEPGPLYDQIRKDKVVALRADRSPDLCGISAPVFEASGKLVGAVTLTAPTSRYNEAWIPVVQQSAASLTRKLGGVF